MDPVGGMGHVVTGWMVGFGWCVWVQWTAVM